VDTALLPSQQRSTHQYRVPYTKTNQAPHIQDSSTPVSVVVLHRDYNTAYVGDELLISLILGFPPMRDPPRTPHRADPITSI
jgi:hypothetical protein